jgi:hypothetical protein
LYTADMGDSAEVPGQECASAPLRFLIERPRNGSHPLATGPPGAGTPALIRGSRWQVVVLQPCPGAATRERGLLW